MLHDFSGKILNHILSLIGVSITNFIAYIVMPIHSPSISVEWVMVSINIILWGMMLFNIIKIIAILLKKEKV